MKKYIFLTLLLIIGGIGFLSVFETPITLPFSLVGHTSCERLPNQYEGFVSPLISGLDEDEDGIDDQTDILENVIAYINTEPQYKSNYYDSGYPDDGFGVCTDVVGAGLKGAGYDLQELVYGDIINHPDDYDIEEPDSKIDFRRVRNLKVYFDHTALSLPTDFSDIEEWQGGDIVVFDGHIGIVSDRRNKDGIPYLIHHANPYQSRYEEDILGKKYKILGHYRIIG